MVHRTRTRGGEAVRALPPRTRAHCSRCCHCAASRWQAQRSSARARAAPVHYAQEKPAMQLEAQKLLGISHAMEASLASDEGDDSPDEPSPPPLSSSSSSEEE